MLYLCNVDTGLTVMVEKESHCVALAGLELRDTCLTHSTSELRLDACTATPALNAEL